MLFALSGCITFYETQPQQASNPKVKPETKLTIPLYNKEIIDFSSATLFDNFIEKNLGKLVHLNMKILGVDPFIEVETDGKPFFTVIDGNDKCVKVAKEENIPRVLACGGMSYHFSGEGYDFYMWDRTFYILSGYFIVPENVGPTQGDPYDNIMLEAIPRKEVLLRGLE